MQHKLEVYYDESAIASARDAMAGNTWKLISRARKLGYDQFNEDSIDLGIAYMGMHAILMIGIDAFNQRIMRIFHSDQSVFENAGANKHPFLDEFILECSAFFEGMQLYQNPFLYKKFFGEHEKTDIQDEHLPMQVIMPCALEQHQGIEQIGIFSGPYSKSFLSNFFNKLHTQMETCVQPLAFIIKGVYITLCVGYDPETKKWLIINPRSLPALTVEYTEVAHHIVSAFSYYSNQTATCSIQICAAKDQAPNMQSQLNAIFQELNLQPVQHKDQLQVHGFFWFYITAREGQLNQLKQLLELNVNLDCRRLTDHATPLSIAIQKGHVDVVALLLKQGYKINIHAPLINGATPLFIAAQWGRVEILELLLAAGADSDIAIKSGATPVYAAAQKGQLSTLSLLLKRGADYNQIRKLDNATPLFAAARNGFYDCVVALVNQGADLDYLCTEDQINALYAATIAGHKNIVGFLLTRSANPQIIMKTNGANLCYGFAHHGWVEHLIALANQNVDIHLKRTDSGETPLYTAAYNGHSKVVSFLLSKGADANVCHKIHGASPLYVAAQNGFYDIVLELLNNGAVVDQACIDDGKTALCAAVCNGHLKIVKVLIEFGADFNIVTKQDKTPLIYAFQVEQVEIFEFLLIEKNAFYNQEKSSAFPLWYATNWNDISVVKALLKAGANPNLIYKRSSALYIAVLLDYYEIAQLLLEHGADFNIVTSDGRTPLYVAAENGNYSIVKLLLDYHADYKKAPYATKKLPLRIALEKNHKDIVELIYLYDELDHLEKQSGSYVKTELEQFKNALKTKNKIDEVKESFMLFKAELLQHKFPLVSPEIKKTVLRHTFFTSGQNWFIERMQSLDYKSNNSGVCFGFGYMVLRAILSEDLLTFNKRLPLIHNTKKEDFLKIVEQNRQQVRAKKSPTEGHYADIPAFFEGVEFCFDPEKYADWFPKDEKPAIQEAKVVMPLIASEVIELGDGIAEVGLFTGSYTYEELILYFQALHQTFAKTDFNHPIGFLLQNIDHIITFTYSQKEKKFLYFDINKLPMQTTTLDYKMADKVMGSFFSRSTTVAFSTRICVLGNHRASAEIFVKSWYQHKEWQKIHECTSEKAKQRDAQGGSWIYLAARDNLIDKMRTLITYEAHLVLHDGVSPLCIAAQNGHIESVQLLIENGVSPDDFNLTTGQPALQYASNQGHLNIVTYLLEKGASPKKCRQDNESPLLYAAINGYISIVKELVFALLKVGGNVDHARNADNITPFYVASEYGYFEIVKYLFLHGANPHHTIKNGSSALFAACKNGHFQIVEFLLKQGVNVNQVRINSESGSSLFIAVQNGHLDIVKLLLEKGADPNACLKNGSSVLHVAVITDRIEIIKLLLTYKIDINKRRTDNLATPLHCAAEKNAHAIINILLQHGADPNIKMKNGFLARELASNFSVIKLIREYEDIQQIEANSQSFCL